MQTTILLIGLTFIVIFGFLDEVRAEEVLTNEVVEDFANESPEESSLVTSSNVTTNSSHPENNAGVTDLKDKAVGGENDRTILEAVDTDPSLEDKEQQLQKTENVAETGSLETKVKASVTARNTTGMHDGGEAPPPTQPSPDASHVTSHQAPNIVVTPVRDQTRPVSEAQNVDERLDDDTRHAGAVLPKDEGEPADYQETLVQSRAKIVGGDLKDDVVPHASTEKQEEKSGGADHIFKVKDPDYFLENDWGKQEELGDSQQAENEDDGNGEFNGGFRHVVLSKPGDVDDYYDDEDEEWLKHKGSKEGTGGSNNQPGKDLMMSPLNFDMNPGPLAGASVNSQREKPPRRRQDSMETRQEAEDRAGFNSYGMAMPYVWAGLFFCFGFLVFATLQHRSRVLSVMEVYPRRLYSARARGEEDKSLLADSHWA